MMKHSFCTLNWVRGGVILPILLAFFNVSAQSTFITDNSSGNVTLSSAAMQRFQHLSDTSSPNPSGGNIILSSSLYNGNPIEYIITNVSGQVMLRGITTQGQNIPTETFESGVYFLNITTEKTTQSLKFIKQ